MYKGPWLIGGPFEEEDWWPLTHPVSCTCNVCVSVPVCLSVSMSVLLSVSICPSVGLFRLSPSMSVCLSLPPMFSHTLPLSLCICLSTSLRCLDGPDGWLPLKELPRL
jgi:hypothetical protein